ncbi:hypothetical protein EMIT0196P_90252 [Pseudomonas chlororaphis]
MCMTSLRAPTRHYLRDNPIPYILTFDAKLSCWRCNLVNQSPHWSALVRTSGENTARLRQ